jgi:hypothetical protein
VIGVVAKMALQAYRLARLPQDSWKDKRAPSGIGQKRLLATPTNGVAVAQHT